jgi:small subunit ribosomal protein S8
MPITDPIADFLTCVRNAIAKKMNKVDVPMSKVKGGILNIMWQEGYILDYKKIEDGKHGVFRVYLKYSYATKENVIKGLKRISKSSCRVYENVDNLPRVNNGLGIAIMSTSRGIITSREAKKQNIGGEVFCHIW